MDRAGMEERKEADAVLGWACRVLQEERPAGKEVVLIRGWHIA